MKDSESRQMDRSQRVQVFTTGRAASFPAGSHAAELIAAHNAASALAEQQAAKQATAHLDWQEQTEQKKAAIKSLLAEMRPINQTARSIEKVMPGIADQFKMPRSSDRNVVNHARGYITAATPIAAEFTKRGLAASFLTSLQARIDAVKAAELQQASALAQKVNATKGLADALKQEADSVRELNPIVRNTFRNDPATLAEWESARRIEKAPKKAKKSSPPPQ